MNSIKLFDSHMHTPLCGHSVGEPEQFVDTAVAQGLSGIIITCHIPMHLDSYNPGGRTRMSKEQLADYREWVKRARIAGEQNGIEVRYGIEAEIAPIEDDLSGMKEILQQEPFDFVLGSLHHQLPSYRSWLKENELLTDQQIISQYFRHLRDGFASGLYDSLAHPDLIQIYGTVTPFDPLLYRDEIQEMLESVKSRDGCIEINTSGLHKGIFQYHPGPDILRWAADTGVGITLGSDSHTPERVGEHFGSMVEILRELGYKEVFSFRNRKKQAHPLY
jgi:histidinol-phosphatase (PHP family)